MTQEHVKKNKVNDGQNIEIVDISRCLASARKQQARQPRLGSIGRKICTLLICIFSLVLLPLFIFMILFNTIYFWIRNQPSISPSQYYHFDRHNINHITFMDKVWCEYCEWANGTLHWTLAITNEIERRYCPIQNKCHPHCEKAKSWRNEFLPFDHKPDKLTDYYKNLYPDVQDTPPDNKRI